MWTRTNVECVFVWTIIGLLLRMRLNQRQQAAHLRLPSVQRLVGKETNITVRYASVPRRIKQKVNRLKSVFNNHTAYSFSVQFEQLHNSGNTLRNCILLIIHLRFLGQKKSHSTANYLFSLMFHTPFRSFTPHPWAWNRVPEMPFYDTVYAFMHRWLHPGDGVQPQWLSVLPLRSYEWKQ